MSNSSKKSKSLVTMVVLSVIFAIAFLGLQVGLLLLKGTAHFMDSLKGIVALVIGSFIFPFNPSSDYALKFDALSSNSGLSPLLMSIVGYVVCGLLFVAIIVGIIVFASKKKGKYVWFSLLLLANIFVAAVILTSGQTYFYSVVGMFKKTIDVLPGVLALLTLLFGVLAVIFCIITYFMLLHAAGKKKQAPAATKSSVVFDSTVAQPQPEPVLAEENIAPEAVQVGEELTAPVEESKPTEIVPIVEPEPEPDPIEVPAPAEEKKEEPAPVEEKPDEQNNHLEVNVNNTPAPQNQIDPNSLAQLLREVVRDIVRDEIARNNVNQPKVDESSRQGGSQNITGATFGGPLVVQYFNGGINGVNPAAAPAPVAEPAPAPVEEKKEEPAPVEEKKEEPVVEETPVAEPTPAVEAVETPLPIVPEAPKEEKPVYERLTFAERLLKSDKDVQDLYNEIKNEILSYGVKSRISANGDTFRLHKKMYVRITVAGKSLKLYFALNPDDYKDSKMPVQDAGHKGMYAEIPLVFKVKSGLSVRRCKELIQDCMDKDGLEQGEIGKVNWIKEMKAELKAGKKVEKDD